MSALAGATQATIATAQSLAQSSAFAQKLTGHPSKVQFIQNSTGTLFTLDISVNETHARESQPTEFPVEYGETISDHVLIGPLTLEITGVISDFPLGTSKQLVAEGITTAISRTGALGLVGAGSAYALYSAIENQRAIDAGGLGNSLSVKAYAQLLRLQAGNPTSNPPVLPQPFDVKTSLHLYPNMIIKSLSVPRDSTTGTSLVFTVSLQQILIVSSQSENVSLFNNPGVAAEKKNIGEQSGKRRNALLDGADYTDDAVGAQRFSGRPIIGGGK